MSSFIRKGAVSAADLGTRPGAAGQTLVSSGQADLDRLLGGGLPLGSLTLILEDGWSQHHTTLLRYFIGEGAACGHSTILATAVDPEGGAHTFLPRLIDPAAAAAEKEKEKTQSGSQEDAVQLRIAWQYGRYLKSQPSMASTEDGSVRIGGQGGGGGFSAQSGVFHGQIQQQKKPLGRDWCHDFDLSKSWTAGAAACSPPAPLQLSVVNGTDAREKLIHSVHVFVQSLQALLPAANASPAAPRSSRSGSVGRVAVASLGSAAWGLEVGSACGGRAVVQALIQLKAIVRDTRCCTVVSVPAGLFTESDKARMAHVADAVLALEVVQDDSDIVRLAPDSQSVAGLLHLRKLPGMGLIAAPTPQTSLYLVRQKRRRFALTPVEIDPEAEEVEAAMGNGGGGKAPAAALLCGGPGKAKPDLDF